MVEVVVHGVFARLPWLHDGEEPVMMKMLHYCENGMGEDENESGRGHHDWNFFPFESDSALEDDSAVKQNLMVNTPSRCTCVQCKLYTAQKTYTVHVPYI